MSEQFVWIFLIAFFLLVLRPGWFLCLIGFHVLPLYPSKVRKIGACKSYEHYICYRCGKEVIK